MKLFISLMVFIAAVFVFALMSKDTSSSPSAQKHTIQSIQADVANGGQFIDVRTPDEYTSGHITGAINLPLQVIQTGALPTVAKDKPVYVYCQSGNRSSQATQILKKAGFTNIIDLGAMSNVQKLGGKVSS